MPFSTKRVTIQVSPSTREALKKIGKKGETFDSIIARLMAMM